VSRLDNNKLLLLDMISSARQAETHAIAALTVKDWQQIDKMARQHRLEPVLHHQIQAIGNAWVVPTDVRLHWASVYHKSAMRSLSLQKTLLGIDDILKGASIPYASLKGAWLAWHAYPHPALRPMRDIDILVPPDQTIDAFDKLLDGGFVRLPQYMMPADYVFVRHKHLPPIVDPRTGVHVEVHSRLVENISATDVLNTCTQLGRRITRRVAKTELSYLSKFDGLLHLIEHSVYDHRFNNGPVVLNDIAMLLKSGPFDWASFWLVANAEYRIRGCRLVFAMVEYYHGDVGICWPAGLDKQVPEAIVKAAALMTLQDFDHRGQVNLRAELGVATSVRKKLALAIERISTSRHILADFSGLSAQSKLIWLVHPLWLGTRLCQYIWPVAKPSVRAEISRAKRVMNWLGEDALSKEV
jgi:Uncharacterised nucleotidyltransferase